MKLGKKAQVEIMGLAILVILLVIILTFALRFSFDSTDNKSDIRTSLVVNGLLNSIIKQQNVRSLMLECYSGVKRGISQEISCEKLKKEINKIISLSVNKKFQVILSSDSLEFFKEGNCGISIQSTPYRFKEQGVTLTALLKLC